MAVNHYPTGYDKVLEVSRKEQSGNARLEIVDKILYNEHPQKAGANYAPVQTIYICTRPH